MRGLVMCCEPRAMQRRAGAAGLYLVRAKLQDGLPPAEWSRIERSGAATYRAWHDRSPEQVSSIELSTGAVNYIGDASVIGYRSDKWSQRGTPTDYEHDYTEPGYRAPEVWASEPDLTKADLVVIIGGNQRITPDGID